MALKHLQVGDDLSGKTLYFTLDTTDTAAVDSSTGRDSEVPFITAGGYYFSQGYNSYSLGTRYYSGVYQGDPDDDRYLEWPTVEFLSVSFYSGGSHASVESSSSERSCPNDCGVVIAIDTSAYFYQYLYINDSEVSFSSKVYLGNQQISKVYLGETPLPKVMFGNSECKPCSFRVNDEYSSSPTFNFEDGQTWKDWIDQGIHYNPQEYNWYYNQYAVGYGDGSLYIPSTYANVLPNDLIINGFAYGFGIACLGPETLIKTDKGLKSISALSVGDKLDENNIVEKIVIHNREKYYKIILENDDVIRASNDHLFITNNKVIKTEALKVGQLLNKLKIKEIRIINKSLDMYEIKTSTNQYTLFDDIICECEDV